VAIPQFHPGKPRPSTRGALEGTRVIGGWQRSRLAQNGTLLGFDAGDARPGINQLGAPVMALIT